MIGIPVPSDSSPWNASWLPSTVSMFVLEDSKISNIFVGMNHATWLGIFQPLQKYFIRMDYQHLFGWVVGCSLNDVLLQSLDGFTPAPLPRWMLRHCSQACLDVKFFNFSTSKNHRTWDKNVFFLNFLHHFFLSKSFRKSKKAGVRINSNWFHLGSLLVGLGWRRNPRISPLSTTPRCFPDFNSHPEKVKRKRHEREVPIFVNKILSLWTQQSWRLGEVACCP